MICPSCGNEINEGTEFCPYCGSSVTPGTGMPATPGAPNLNTQNVPSILASQEKNIKKRAAKKIIFLVIAVVVVIVIVLAIWGGNKLMNSQGNASSTAQSVSSASVSSSSSEAKTVSYKDFLGTWQCESFDFKEGDGRRLFTKQLAFDDTKVVYEGNKENDTYLAAWCYLYENPSDSGQIILDRNDWVTLSDDRQTLTYHVDQRNYSKHDQKEYTFKKTSPDSLRPTALIKLLGTWYSQSAQFNITFKDDGQYYDSENNGAVGKWHLYLESDNNLAVKVECYSKSNVYYFIYTTKDCSELTNVFKDDSGKEGRVVYKRTPLTSSSSSTQK